MTRAYGDDETRRVVAILGAELEHYRRAEERLAEAREVLHDQMRIAARDHGASAYRLALATGLSERHVGRVLKGR